MLRRSKQLQFRYCVRCGTKVIFPWPMQIYCGDRNKKWGCSYLQVLEYWRRYSKRKKKWLLPQRKIKQKIWQKKWCSRNKEHVKEYQKEYREKHKKKHNNEN